MDATRTMLLLFSGWLLALAASAQDMETVTGTIYCNNEASLYVNGQLVASDPVPGVPHNAFNVRFQVPAGKPVTLAIDAVDFDTNDTGLELGRCIGPGVLRAQFSNGIVTNGSWSCFTYLYGPVNWKQCYAYNPEVGPGHAACSPVNDSFPVLTGCWGRRQPRPQGWAEPGFDASGWARATEWEESYVGFGRLPAGCGNGSLESSEVDTNGEPLICQNNVDWSAFGDARFIWGDDLDLDNRLLCRYTTPSSTSAPVAMAMLLACCFFLATALLTSE